jgi:hypothetical protein
MSYEKGDFAFFDGSRSQYRKALKLADTIADYKIANITPNSVRLAAGTNELELRVGMRLRREDQGPWVVGPEPRAVEPSPFTPASASAGPGTTPDTSSGPESDVLKRLMQRREQE